MNLSMSIESYQMKKLKQKKWKKISSEFSIDLRTEKTDESAP